MKKAGREDMEYLGSRRKEQADERGNFEVKLGEVVL